MMKMSYSILNALCVSLSYPTIGYMSPDLQLLLGNLEALSSWNRTEPSQVQNIPTFTPISPYMIIFHLILYFSPQSLCSVIIALMCAS